MRKHRSFKPDQKARAVLQVLTGQKSPAQICRELQISESLLARWKQQFLDGASSAAVYARIGFTIFPSTSVSRKYLPCNL
jgi:transposase-like protein